MALQFSKFLSTSVLAAHSVLNTIPTTSFASLSLRRMTTLNDKLYFLIIYSIGNPEPKYYNTRHSMGHYVANRLQETLACSSWLRSSRLAQCSSALPASFPAVLVKSDTYMNVSGHLVAKNWRILKKTKENEGYKPILVVLHDELSLPVGKTQLRKKDASPRGHNGLKSIRLSLGGDFLSIAIGIGRPESRDPHTVAKYVLEKIPEGELVEIETVSMPKIELYFKEVLNGKHV